MIDIPEPVRNKATEAGAEWWLDDLPSLLERLGRDWSIRIGVAYPDATEALVAEAEMSDGTEAVLKLMVPRPGNGARHEAAVLRLADGEGCVTLLRSDEDRGALLLERLGPSLYDLDVPIGQRHEILCHVAEQLWRPGAGHGFVTGGEKALWLVDRINAQWDRLGRPCSRQAVDHALACAARRGAAHDDERSVLVHGDVHQWNVLAAGDDYKLVDPDGLLAEREYDLGILMREDPLELMEGDPFDRALWLAERCEADATAIWEWGVVERVSTGLLATAIDLQPVAAEMLAAADRIAELYPE